MAALVRSATPMRLNTLLMWAFTVDSLIPRYRAICLLAKPFVTSLSTCRSRVLSSSAGRAQVAGRYLSYSPGCCALSQAAALRDDAWHSHAS